MHANAYGAMACEHTCMDHTTCTTLGSGGVHTHVARRSAILRRAEIGTNSSTPKHGRRRRPRGKAGLIFSVEIRQTTLVAVRHQTGRPHPSEHTMLRNGQAPAIMVRAQSQNFPDAFNQKAREVQDMHDPKFVFP
jgi:hypothetical protein